MRKLAENSRKGAENRHSSENASGKTPTELRGRPGVVENLFQAFPSSPEGGV